MLTCTDMHAFVLKLETCSKILALFHYKVKTGIIELKVFTIIHQAGHHNTWSFKSGTFISEATVLSCKLDYGSITKDMVNKQCLKSPGAKAWSYLYKEDYKMHVTSQLTTENGIK